MTILCIETSTQVCSAAVTIGGVPIAERIQRTETNHAQLLPVFVDALQQELHTKGLAIEAVALSEGPGSYTGLRIGTGIAKGLCYGLSVPLVPVPTLQVLAAAAVARYGNTLAAQAMLCPMVDARRMEVYTALYDEELSEVNPVQAKVVEDTEWLTATGREVYYFGDGAAKCQAVLSAPSLHYLDGVLPEAKYMGVLAERMLIEGNKGADIAYYEPYYLKEFVAAAPHVKGLTQNA